MIKEEIKSFLANRRISQAVVAQVTGEYKLNLFGKTQAEMLVCVNKHQTPTSVTLVPLLQGSVRAGSPTGSYSRDRTSASRRSERSSAGTSWRRPILVTANFSNSSTFLIKLFCNFSTCGKNTVK